MRSPEARKAALLMALALAPSGGLAYFGLRSIAADEREASRRLAARAREAERAVDRHIEERIQACAERLREVLGPEDEAIELERLRPRLEAVAESREDIFLAFAVNEADRVFLPRPPNRVRPRAIPQSEVRRYRELIAFSNEARGRGDREFARTVLLIADSAIEHPRLKALLEQALAGQALRDDDLNTARGHLTTLFRRYPNARAFNDTPLAVRAWIELAELGGPEDGERREPLIALGEALATNRWGLGRPSRDAYWELMLAALKTSPGDDPAELIAALSGLRDFYDVFRPRAIPEIRRVLEGLPAGEPVSVEVRALGRSYVFVAAAIEPGDFAPFVGFQLRLEALAEGLRGDLERLTEPYEARLVVYAGDERIAGDPELSLEPGAGRALGLIEGWRARALPRDPEAPLAAARRRRLLTALILGSCFLAAAVGGGLTLRSIDQQVAHAQVRNKLVRNVSHELRTPIASLRMLAEILQDGGLPRPREQEYFDRLAAQSRRLGRIVENVLTLARIEEGARVLRLSPVPLGAAVTPIFEAFRASEEGRRAALALVDRSQGARALLDPEALDQVLTNLLSNAVKYGAGSPVEVRVEAEKGRVRLMVKDGGPGIPEEARDKLLTPFYRVREEGTTTGIGIGLSIVKELVGLMRGELRIVDEGGGACFVVILPRAAG